MVPSEHLNTHYLHLLPIFNEGRERSNLPIAHLEAEFDPTLPDFEQIHKIAILFLVQETDVQLIKDLVPFPPNN